MMRFVDVFVEEGMVKQSVHPVDAIVSEEQETKRVKKVSVWHPVKVRKEYRQWNGGKQIEIAIGIEAIIQF